MNDNEKNEVYFGGYGIPEIWTDEPQTISIFESPAISSMAPQKARVAEPPELIPMGRKKARRPVMAVVAAVACSMALMFGSGLAGAKLVEGRLGALSGDVAASQTYNPAADVFDDSGSSDSVVNSLGSVNPDGGTLSLTE
ncbi:MAG: hypothetical protein LBH28_06550, partial [Oscillospiraceae bacterium]|nr:hypothetical protein [Oscillospiraceae bacterium]